MHPFDQITNRDHAAFPFEQFRSYSRLFMVDWRESDCILGANLVPFLVAPDQTRASMILPHRYWPYKLWES